MSTDSTLSVPYKVTLKGQGQTDPWLTVEGRTLDEFRINLAELVEEDTDEEGAPLDVPALIAAAAAEYVGALNAQPGISSQRDRAATSPATPAASPAAGATRPALSTSLTVEDDGNYWITLPYQRQRALGDKQREYAKGLGARYKPDDCPASVPRNAKGAPERPWCVHQRFVSEENVAELLRLHETGFAEIK